MPYDQKFKNSQVAFLVFCKKLLLRSVRRFEKNCLKFNQKTEGGCFLHKEDATEQL